MDDFEMPPAPAPGMTRLYRAGSSGAPVPVAEWIAQSAGYANMLAARGRWFAATLDEALWCLGENGGGDVLYLDLPGEEAEAARVSRQAGRSKDVPDSPRAWSADPEREFFVSRQAADRAVPLGTRAAVREDRDGVSGSAPACAPGCLPGAR